MQLWREILDLQCRTYSLKLQVGFLSVLVIILAVVIGLLTGTPDVLSVPIGIVAAFFVVYVVDSVGNVFTEVHVGVHIADILRCVSGERFVRPGPGLAEQLGADPESVGWLTAAGLVLADLGVVCLALPLDAPALCGSPPPGTGGQVEAELVGSETLDGRVPTTVVRLSVPARLLVEQLMEAGTADEATAKELRRIGETDLTVHVDAWIADDGRVHRTAIDLSWMLDADTGPLLLTKDYSFHGEETGSWTERPPAADITGDITDFGT